MKPSNVDVEISANLWTSSTGNTYHRVYVTVDGRGHEQLTSEITYGGGAQYTVTAAAMLQAAGVVARGSNPSGLVAGLRKQGAHVVEGSRYVPRKRDM